MKKWVNSEADVNRVWKNLKDVMLAAKYLNVPAVNTIYHNQGTRVAAALKVAEDGIEANWASTATPYTKQGLDTLWTAWIRDYTTLVNQKVDEYLQLWAGNLNVQITFYQNQVNQGVVLTPAQQTILGHMQACVAEVATFTAGNTLFTNPF